MGLSESMAGRGLFLGIPVYSPEGVNLSPFSSENIGGIGVDICDVARIQQDIDRNPLYKQSIYTPEEITYCNRATGEMRAQRYAARFAAKEAVAKAIGGMPYRYLDVCVLKEEDGKPLIELRGRAKEYADQIGIGTIFISLSHIRDATVAFSIAVKHPSP